MATVKIVLRKKLNNDGTYPLAVRITKDRKSSFVTVGQSLKEVYWDAKKSRVRKSHPNSERLNNFLLKKLSEANDKVLEMSTQEDHVSAQAMRKRVKPGSGGAGFFSVAKLYLDNFRKTKKYNRLSTEEPRIKRFKEFIGGEIPFKEITPPLLDRFKAHLKGTYNLSERSIMNYLLLIRTVYNLALKENIVERKHYPFGKEKVQIKYPQSLKIGLMPEEIHKIENLELKIGSPQHHARNLWLFSFYLAGIRVSDLLRLRWSDFHNGRLFYTMGKNNKPGSLKLNEKHEKILVQYKKDKKSADDLVFPELKALKNLDNSYEVERKISFADKNINKHLKKVAEAIELDKKLTMHIARHTFGNISGEKIPVQMLQKLYRHSNITTTIGYQANFVNKETDDALDAVLKY